MDARRALFTGLIDYAGLFPPAQLDMQAAVEEYGALRGASMAWMLGRFIVPASRVFEMSKELENLQAEDAPPQPYALSAIVDAGSDARTWLGNAGAALDSLVRARSEGLPVKTESLEVPAPALLAARDTYDWTVGQFAMLAQNAGLRERPIFVEFARNDSWERLLPGGMAALGRAKFGAKLRCGGVTADAFPSSEQVVTFLRAAYENAVAFKATAGLHHPIRRHDPATGFTMHGFLNLLAAATFIRDGASDAELVEILEERDAGAFSVTDDALKWRHRIASAAQIGLARSAGFIGFGSCSFEEPLADLVTLGILSPAATV